MNIESESQLCEINEEPIEVHEEHFPQALNQVSQNIEPAQMLQEISNTVITEKTLLAQVSHGTIVQFITLIRFSDLPIRPGKC